MCAECIAYHKAFHGIYFTSCAQKKKNNSTTGNETISHRTVDDNALDATHPTTPPNPFRLCAGAVVDSGSGSVLVALSSATATAFFGCEARFVQSFSFCVCVRCRHPKAFVCSAAHSLHPTKPLSSSSLSSLTSIFAEITANWTHLRTVQRTLGGVHCATPPPPPMQSTFMNLHGGAAAAAVPCCCRCCCTDAARLCIFSLCARLKFVYFRCVWFVSFSHDALRTATQPRYLNRRAALSFVEF